MPADFATQQVACPLAHSPAGHAAKAIRRSRVSEPTHGGPVTDFVDDLYHKLGDDAAVAAAIREVMQKYVKPYFASISPAPDFIDNLLYPFLENAVAEGVVRGHALIHKD